MNQQDLSKAHFDRLTTDEKIDVFAQGYRVPQKKSKSDALDELWAKTPQISTKAQSSKFRIYWSAAASVALIVILTTFYFQNVTTQIIAKKGQHVEQTLPDGSSVTVNADSKLRFSKSKFAQKRTLNLEGEAFFSVEKGSPFIIKTPSGIVQVLGTTLNVYSRGDNLSVSCLTGKVMVQANGQTAIIEPGEKAELQEGLLVKTGNIPNENMNGWIRFDFSFDNKPLISIFEEIERQFNVKIIAQNIENRYFTGNFSNKNLTEVLETICLPMKLEYEFKNTNTISIKPKKK